MAVAQQKKRVLLHEIYYRPSGTLIFHVCDWQSHETYLRVMLAGKALTCLTPINSEAETEFREISKQSATFDLKAATIRDNLKTLLANYNDTFDEFPSHLDVLHNILHQLDSAFAHLTSWKSTGSHSTYFSGRSNMGTAFEILRKAEYRFRPDLDWESIGFPTPPEITPDQYRQQFAKLAQTELDVWRKSFQGLENRVDQELQARMAVLNSANARFESTSQKQYGELAKLSADIVQNQTKVENIKAAILADIRREVFGEHDELGEEIEAIKQLIASTEEEVATGIDRFRDNINFFQDATAEAGRTRLLKYFVGAQQGAWISFAFFFLCFGAGAVGVSYVLFSTIQPGVALDWPVVAARLASASLGFYFTLFAARQATRSRNTYADYQRMVAEISTIDAYLARHDPELAKKIKLALLPEYFGRLNSGNQLEPLPDIDGANPGKLVAMFFAKIVGQSGKETKELKAALENEKARNTQLLTIIMGSLHDGEEQKLLAGKEQQEEKADKSKDATADKPENEPTST